MSFDPDIWGTVSDWFNSLVTLGAGVLLFLTFRSQIAVQKQQQVLMEIENARHVQEIKPEFKMTVPFVTEEFLNGIAHADTLFVFTLNSNFARKVHITHEGVLDHWKYGSRLPFYQEVVLPNNTIVVPAQNTNQAGVNYTTETQFCYFAISLKVVFEDIKGNLYQQTFHCQRFDGQTHLDATVPVLTAMNSYPKIV